MTFTIYQLKPAFQRLLAPLLNTLQRCKVTPNQVTLFTMCLSILYGLVLAFFPHFWLWIGFPLFMLVRMALNAIDGMLADATGQKTPLGAILNEMCDQISDVALYLPFALIASVLAPLLLAVVILMLLAEFAGVTALAIGASRRFEGPMGKSDRAAGFGLLALLIAFNIDPIWINILLILMALLLVWTTVNRLRQALLQIRS